MDTPSLASPAWLPFRLNEEGVRFLAMTPEAYRSASFLDERIVDAESVFTDQTWANLPATHDRPPAHWIFHIGHVGSTLISRLLQDLPNVLALREPAILRSLVTGSPTADASWEATAPRSRAERLQIIAHLLSRRYNSGQVVILKATSYASAIGPELLSYVQGRARLLVVKPTIYAASVIAGSNTALELRALVNSRVARLSDYLGGNIEIDLDDIAQLAAMTWLTEICALARIAAAHPGRCRWMDFEAFLEAPGASLARIATDFGVAASEGEVASAVAGPTMTRYSKDPSYIYNSTDRRALAAQAQVAHGLEIARAMGWLNDLGSAFPAARAAMTAMAAGLRE